MTRKDGLADWLGSLFTAGRGEPRDVEKSLAQIDRELTAQYGSRRAWCKALGHKEPNVRRWLKGDSHPSPTNKALLQSAVRSARVSVHDAPSDASVRLDVKDRGSERVRKLTAKKLDLQPGTMEAARQAYVDGGPAAAAQVFRAGIGDEWYRQWLTPGSPASRTGTVDGSGGGPAGAVRRLDAGAGAPGSAGGGGGGGDLGYDGGDGGFYDGGDDDGDDSHMDWADGYEGGDDDADAYGADVVGGSR